MDYGIRPKTKFQSYIRLNRKGKPVVWPVEYVNLNINK